MVPDQAFEGLAYRRWSTGAPGRSEVLVERVLDEGVGEAVAPGESGSS